MNVRHFRARRSAIDIRRPLAAALTAAIALGGVVAPALPGPVDAAASTTALYTDGPGPLTEGRPTYLPGATTIWSVTRTVDGNELDIQVDDAACDPWPNCPGDPYDHHWVIQVAAPAGDTIVAGTYSDVVQPRATGQPWIGLHHGGSTCGNAYGQFEILGLSLDGAGNVTSLALTIEYDCNHLDDPASFVDLRFASTVPLKVLTTGTTALDFGTQVTGRPSPVTTVDVAAEGSVASTISSVSVTGPDAGDFAVSADTCAGSTLDPGATCHFAVRMTASATGSRQATLTIVDDAYPGSHPIDLTGTGTAFSIAPTTLDFGYPVVFSKTSKTITLTNGNQSRSLGSFVVNSVSRDITSPAKEFSLRTDIGCPTQSTIAALSSCDVTIDYEPVTAAGATGTVTWLVAGSPIDSIQLSGWATPTSAVTWTYPPTSLRGGAWTSGNSLARSVRGTSSYLHAGVSSDYVHNHWATDKGPYVGVYYRRSVNGGRNWAASARINPANKHGARASVAASGKYVYVTWVSQTKWVHYSRKAPRVLYIRVNATYGKGAWGVAHRLTPLAGRVDYPVVAVSGATVYVAYTDAKTGKVRISISRNHGKTWASATLGLTTQLTSDGRAGFPSVAVSGANVVVAWTADASGRVNAKVSTNAGRTWTLVTLATASRGSTAAGAANGRLSVVWPTAGGTEIRTWATGAWGDPVTVLPPAGPGFYGWFATPSVALYGTGVTGIAWTACRADCTTGSPLLDLVWAESADGGATFPSRQVIVPGALYHENWYPSVVWGSPTTRYVMNWASYLSEGSHVVQFRIGEGSPN